MIGYVWWISSHILDAGTTFVDGGAWRLEARAGGG